MWDMSDCTCKSPEAIQVISSNYLDMSVVFGAVLYEILKHLEDTPKHGKKSPAIFKNSSKTI